MSRAIVGTIVAVLIFAGMSAQDKTPKPQEKSPESPELKVLDRMVGSWRMEIVEAQANGEEEENTATGVGKWSLQGKYVEFRIVGSEGKEAILHLFNYDSNAKVYNMWTFSPDSHKSTHTKWNWDESAKTLSGSIDLGNGMKMNAATRFIGNDRFEYTGITKDASGNVLGEMKGKSVRKKYGDKSTATQPSKSPVSPRSPEMNVLDRFAGSWRFEEVEKPATGEEKKNTGIFNTKWSLQGNYIEIRAISSGGKHAALEFWTYDPKASAYKMWIFDSKSPAPHQANMQWNESKETFSLENADMGNGITANMSIGFIGNDRMEWTMTIEDAAGNVMQENKGKSFRTK